MSQRRSCCIGWCVEDQGEAGKRRLLTFARVNYCGPLMARARVTRCRFLVAKLTIMEIESHFFLPLTTASRAFLPDAGNEFTRPGSVRPCAPTALTTPLLLDFSSIVEEAKCMHDNSSYIRRYHYIEFNMTKVIYITFYC